MVQSAVSAAITALEKDLRVVLIERNARRVQLTEAGEALLPEAQAVLDAALAARDAVEGLSRGLRGTLRVGMLSDLGLMDLPGLARDFRDRHPGVELQLRDATAGFAGMLSALSGYDVDVAFAGASGPLPREYAGRTLLRVPQLLAVPAGHALAGRRAVGIRELEHETFIDLPLGFAMRTVADEVFTAYGMRRAIAAEIGVSTPPPHSFAPASASPSCPPTPSHRTGTCARSRSASTTSAGRSTPLCCAAAA